MRSTSETRSWTRSPASAVSIASGAGSPECSTDRPPSVRPPRRKLLLPPPARAGRAMTPCLSSSVFVISRRSDYSARNTTLPALKSSQANIRQAGKDVNIVEILGSILQPQSKQIAREGLQKDRTVDKKMAAGKHSSLTASHGHLAPGRQPPGFDFTILQPAVNHHRAFKRGFRMIFVSLAEFEIGAGRRQHQIQKFVILQNFRRGAVELAKFFDQ